MGRIGGVKCGSLRCGTPLDGSIAVSHEEIICNANCISFVAALNKHPDVDKCEPHAPKFTCLCADICSTIESYLKSLNESNRKERRTQ
jgi:hypothetical protein